MNKHVTDANTPGERIGELLTQRGWTQRTLARILNIGETRLTRVITDKQPVDAEFALLLQDVFGEPAEQFLALQTMSELANARQSRTPDPELAARINVYGELPLGEMIKRGWLSAKGISDVEAVERSLKLLFEVEHTSQIEALRSSSVSATADSMLNASHLAWLYRLKQVAGRLEIMRYEPTKLRNAFATLKTKMRRREDVAGVTAILSQCGITLILIETLVAGPLDGGCVWLKHRSPVIALTLREDRLDTFWFLLCQQLEAILLLREEQALVQLDYEHRLHWAWNIADDRAADIIAASSQSAHEFCVPSHDIKCFLDRVGPILTERDIIEYAAFLRVHPAILAGEVSRQIGRQNRFQDCAPKIRALVAASAKLVDGWGWYASCNRLP